MYLIVNNSRDGGDGAREGEAMDGSSVCDWLLEAE